MENIEKDFRAEDIPIELKTGEPNLWREVADKFGPEVVLFIAKKAGGDRVQYLPPASNLLRPAVGRAYPVR